MIKKMAYKVFMDKNETFLEVAQRETYQIFANGNYIRCPFSKYKGDLPEVYNYLDYLDRELVAIDHLSTIFIYPEITKALRELKRKVISSRGRFSDFSMGDYSLISVAIDALKEVRRGIEGETLSSNESAERSLTLALDTLASDSGCLMNDQILRITSAIEATIAEFKKYRDH